MTYGRKTPDDSVYIGDLAAFIKTVNLLFNPTVFESVNLLIIDITAVVYITH